MASEAAVLRLPVTAGGSSILTLLDGRPAIVLDEWVRLADDDPLPQTGAVVLSRARLEALGDTGLGGLQIGVWIPGDSDVDEVAELLRRCPVDLVAIEVPKFTDGRHFSLARLLRDRHAFSGELRAFGDVLPDQLFYMRRCGYTAFELKAGKSLETGLRTLRDFTVTYQAGVDDPRPLYRRRA